jgi:hypothetical protein
MGKAVDYIAIRKQPATPPAGAPSGSVQGQEGAEYYGPDPDSAPEHVILKADVDGNLVVDNEGIESIVGSVGGGGGGPALSNSNPQPLGTAAPGNSSTASRSNHVHQMPSAADVGAASASHNHDADYADVAHDHDGEYATIGHTHAGGGGAALSDDNPAALGAAAPGTSEEASRADHVHPTTGLALSGHDHDSDYSDLAHDHDGVYALIDHSHGGGGGGGSSTSYSAYASRPSSPASGDVALFSDAPVLQRYNGSSWQSLGPIFRFVDPPALGSWTQINMSGATVEQAGPHIYLECPAPGATAYAIRALAVAPPTAPWTLTVHWLPNWLPGASNVIGLGVRDDTTGRIESLKNFQDEAIYQSRWSSVSGFSSNAKTLSIQGGQGPTWLRLTDDGTDFIWKFSRDGLRWMTYNTTARNAWVASIDQILFLLDARSTTASVGATLVHWEVT